MRILIIEDNEDDQFFIKNQLQKPGVGILIYPDFSSIASAKNNFAPDVCILDLVMPGAPPPAEMVAYTREALGNDVAIVVLTGHDEVGLAERAILEGADNFVVKSIASYMRLRDIVDQAVELKRRQISYKSLDVHGRAALADIAKDMERTWSKLAALYAEFTEEVLSRVGDIEPTQPEQMASVLEALEDTQSHYLSSAFRVVTDLYRGVVPESSRQSVVAELLRYRHDNNE